MRSVHAMNFSLFWTIKTTLVSIVVAVLTACGVAPSSVENSQTPNLDNPATSTASDVLTATQTPIPTFDGAVETVTVGIFGLSSDAAVFIAMERGYFASQGIEVETSTFSALSDMIPALATGQLDVGNANTGAALFNALGSEYGLKIVADNATIELNNDGSALVIRQELADQIQTPADLRGRQIGAVADRGTPAHICLEELLAPSGLTAEDVDMVQLPYPAMGAALANGAVDGAIIVEPFLSSGLNQGLFVIYKGTGEMCPGDEVNVQVYSADFAVQTDLAQRFALARLQGARDFNNAFFRNIDRDAIVSILTQYTTLTDPALYADVRFTTMNPDGAVNIDSLEAYLAWYVEHGFVEQSFDLNVAIDNTFSEYAVEVVGSYE